MNLYNYTGNNPVNLVDPWGLTANCPATVEFARLMRTQFIRYPNRKGEEMFHCGYECYLENRSEGYCPDNPGAECCYDEKGLLVDENHKYAKCGGSNDDYFCKSMTTETSTDCLKHAGPADDRGGIWNRGEEAKKETRRHYCDTHPGACEKN